MNQSDRSGLVPVRQPGFKGYPVRDEMVLVKAGQPSSGGNSEEPVRVIALNRQCRVVYEAVDGVSSVVVIAERLAGTLYPDGISDLEQVRRSLDVLYDEGAIAVQGAGL